MFPGDTLELVGDGVEGFIPTDPGKVTGSSFPDALEGITQPIGGINDFRGVGTARATNALWMSL
jgi:hypothetical protein